MQEGMPPDEGASASPGEVIAQTEKGLAELAASVPDEGAKAELTAILEQFRAVIEALASGGGGAPRPEAGGATTPEQGGNPNARPMGV